MDCKGKFTEANSEVAPLWKMQNKGLYLHDVRQGASG